MKIAVALSGGVDSAAVALRLKQAGHEIIGITLDFCQDGKGMAGFKIAQRLGIRHEQVSPVAEFNRLVIKPFVRAFTAGLTPNPCACCNRDIKFGLLREYAFALGVEALATGHYARLVWQNDKPLVKRADDFEKDQTYFLSLVPMEKFKKVLFPLSEDTKSQVWNEMQSAGWQFQKDEASKEICFLGSRSYTDLLQEKVPEAFKSGEIVDESGRVLGEHNGLPNYTIGQRRGLGVAASHPLYVIRLEADANRVVAGPDQALWSRTARLQDVNWFIDPPAGEMRVQTQIRYRQRPVPARMKILENNQLLLSFEEPVRAVTPGQVGAVYHDHCLVAGGEIA